MSLVCSASLVDNKGKLYVFTLSGNLPAVYSLDNLEKIMFSETSMHVWVENKSTDYVYDIVRLLTFSDEDRPAAVKSLANVNSGITIDYARSSGKVYISCLELIERIVVYDVRGRLAFETRPRSKSYSFTIADCPKGIYILKVLVKGQVKTKKILK